MFELRTDQFNNKNLYFFTLQQIEWRSTFRWTSKSQLDQRENRIASSISPDAIERSTSRKIKLIVRSRVPATLCVRASIRDHMGVIHAGVRPRVGVVRCVT